MNGSLEQIDKKKDDRMDLIFSWLTTREVALGIWLLFLTCLFSLSKNVRKSARALLANFFVTSILLSILLLIIYVSIVAYSLSLIGFWTSSLLKDTFVWGATVAFIMQMNANKIKDKNYFKDIVKDTFKWTIVVEFVLNLHTFSLLIELLLVPMFLFLGAMQGYAMTDKKYEKVQKLVSKTILIFGLAIFLIALYKTIAGFDEVLTVANLMSLIFPIIMTLLVLPFIYCYATYIRYDEQFSLVSHFSKSQKKSNSVKRQIVVVAGVNLTLLWKIRMNLHKVDFSKENLNGVIGIS